LRIERKFDEKVVEDIARKCGSKSVRQSIAWLRRAHYNNPDKFVCEILDGVAFWAADICKTHMRLYEIAVREDIQRGGYGRAMMVRMFKTCKANKLNRITFRTAKDETALEFYKKFGAIVVGDKGEDWEVEIRL